MKYEKCSNSSNRQTVEGKQQSTHKIHTHIYKIVMAAELYIKLLILVIYAQEQAYEIWYESGPNDRVSVVNE